MRPAFARRQRAPRVALLPLAVLGVASELRAQSVTTDIVAREVGGASFGAAQQIVPGPDLRFHIPEAEFGDRPGGGDNLFFSFDHFDLASGDTAVFQGNPARFVVSRVTDGAPSLLHGRLSSEIAGADHIFVNPAGVTFGPAARIEVPGSFHVASADFVRFGEGDQAADWDTRACCTKLASALPPEAFGFATRVPGDIDFDGMAFDPSSTGTVAPGQTLSAIGGNVRVTGTGALQTLSLAAPGGAIQLGATPGSGNAAAPTWVPLDLAGFDPSSTSPQAGTGTVTLENSAYLYATNDFSGVPSIGRVVVRGGRFEVLASPRPVVIESGGDAPDPDPPPAIDVQVADAISIEGAGLFASAFDSDTNGGTGGDIRLEGRTLRLADDAQVLIRSGGSAVPGSLEVDVERATLEAGARIQSWAEGIEEGAAIAVAADELVVRDFAEIQSLTRTAAAGGDVRVDAESVGLERGAITAVTYGAGTSGDIDVSGVEAVEVGPGALIATATLSDPDTSVPENTGAAGAVRIASEGLVRVAGDESGGVETEISARAISASGIAGAAGSIEIEADRLEILSGGRITATSTGGERAGDVAIRASSVLVSGRGGVGASPSAVSAASQVGGGSAGSLSISGAQRVDVSDGGRLSVEALDVTAGPSGDLLIETAELRVHGGSITTESRSPSSVGGDIRIRGGPPGADGSQPRVRQIDVVGSRISTATTFEGAGALSMRSGSLVVQRSVVESKAGLAGGDLALDARGLFVTGGGLEETSVPGQLAALDAGRLDSLFDASSRLSVPGALELTRPNDVLAGQLVSLPDTFYADEDLLRNQCETRSAPIGSLTVRGRDRAPAAPDEDLRIDYQGGQ